MAAKTQTTITAPRKQLFRALEAKSLRNRPFPTRLADALTSLTSTPAFLFLNIAFFIFWITINSNLIPGIQAFDPYPFGLLTMAVSLEAIVLSIFVLISQDRAARIATLRDELNLRINLIAEKEVTKILQILSERYKSTNDPELTKMLQDIDASDLEQSILQQIERADQLIHRKKFAKGDVAALLNSLVKPK